MPEPQETPAGATEVPAVAPAAGTPQPTPEEPSPVPSFAPSPTNFQAPQGNPVQPVVPDPNAQPAVQPAAPAAIDPNQLVDSSGIAKKYLPNAPEDVLNAVKPVTDAFKQAQSHFSQREQQLMAENAALRAAQAPAPQVPAAQQQVPPPIDYSKIQTGPITDPTILDIKPQDLVGQVTQSVVQQLDQRQQVELDNQKAQTIQTQLEAMETDRARQLLHKAAISVGNKDAIARYNDVSYKPNDAEIQSVRPILEQEAQYIYQNIKPIDTVTITVNTPQGPVNQRYELYDPKAFEMADRMMNNQEYAQQNYQKGVDNAIEQMSTVNAPVVADPQGTISAPRVAPANLDTRQGAYDYANSLTDAELDAVLKKQGSAPVQRR
jgi:hypothetical protein